VSADGCLLVSSQGKPQELRPVAEQIRPEPDRLTVVMDVAEPTSVLQLADRLRRWVPQRWTSVRLVAAKAAAIVDGECAAWRLSEMLGGEILAPDGDLVLVPDGSLFVVDDKDPDGLGTWWQFTPNQEPTRLGCRYPAPHWAPDLAGFTDPGIADAVVEQVPCGLWLRRPGPTTLGDLAYSVPVLVNSMILLVSRPGEAGLTASQVGGLIEALPRGLYEQMIIAPYGDQPVADGRLGVVASRAAGCRIRLSAGLPLYVPDSGPGVVAVRADGMPTWRPFAREVAWSPRGGGEILDCIPPVARLRSVLPGQFALDRRWLVEVTESGLWVRPRDRVDDAAVVHALPLDARRCTIVLSAPGEYRKPPWRAITRLLAGLPDDARSRLRVAVPTSAGDWLADAAARAFRGVLTHGRLVRLHPDGRMTRWTPADRR
jgi:hypothetical protein